MRDRVTRTAFGALGVAASLAWAVLFLRAPGVALELLLVSSPVIIAVWLVVMLTAPARGARSGTRRPPAAGGLPARTADDVPAAVLARDRRICALCGTSGAGCVAARRPARRSDTDPLARFITLCERCAATGAFTALPARRPAAPSEPG